MFSIMTVLTLNFDLPLCKPFRITGISGESVIGIYPIASAHCLIFIYLFFGFFILVAQMPDAEDVFMEEDKAPNASGQEAKEEDGGSVDVNEGMDKEITENMEEEIVSDETIHEVTGALKLLKCRGSLRETIEWGVQNIEKKMSKAC